MYNGLTDIDQRGNLVPSLAESWEPNKELSAWTFRLRKGVLFHNGREFDAEAVKLNILRIQDPAIGHDFIRGGLENVDSVEVLDKYTVRINAKVPDAALPIKYHALPDYPDGSGRLRDVRRTPHWHGSLQVRLLDALERHPAGAL